MYIHGNQVSRRKFLLREILSFLHKLILKIFIFINI